MSCARAHSTSSMNAAADVTPLAGAASIQSEPLIAMTGLGVGTGEDVVDDSVGVCAVVIRAVRPRARIASMRMKSVLMMM